MIIHGYSLKYDFYTVWSKFDNAAIAKIPNFYGLSNITDKEDGQRNILYKTILTNLDLFDKFKTEEDMLNIINKIIESLEECDIFQYTNAIINIFRVARLAGDLEKGFELYEKIK